MREISSPQDSAISSCEVADGKVGELAITYTVIGEVTGQRLPGIQGYEDHDGRGSGGPGKRLWKKSLRHVPVLRQMMQPKVWTKVLYDAKDVAYLLPQDRSAHRVYPRISAEPTANTTAQRHLKERERRLLPRYSRIWMRSTSVILWKSLKKPLTRRR